jgi:3-deoxy-D-arabino-heptulosonate 7-phosphate (DAHP) synthase
MDRFGDAIAVWNPLGNSAMESSARRGIAGAWQRPVGLGQPSGGVLQFAVDPRGNAISVWAQPTTRQDHTAFIDAAVYRLNGARQARSHNSRVR